MFIELVSQTQMPQPLRTIVRTEKLDSYYVVTGRHSFYSSSNTVEMRTQDGYISFYIPGSIQTSSQRKVLVRASETSPVTPSLLSIKTMVPYTPANKIYNSGPWKTSFRWQELSASNGRSCRLSSSAQLSTCSELQTSSVPLVCRGSSIRLYETFHG